jgi:hypothetical protein
VKLVYIAGPFTGETAWEIEGNVRRAEAAGLEVAWLGGMPVIPHANTRFFHGQCAPSFWYEGTLELLSRCDAMLVQGDWENSWGTKDEMRLCDNQGIPYFLKLADLAEWLRKNGC